MSDKMVKYGYEAVVLAAPDAGHEANKEPKPFSIVWHPAPYLIGQDFRQQHFRRAYRQLSPVALKPFALTLRKNVTGQLSFHPVPGAFFKLMVGSVLQSIWQEVKPPKALLVPIQGQKIEEAGAASLSQSLNLLRFFQNGKTATRFEGMKAQRLSFTLQQTSAPVIEISFLGIASRGIKEARQIAEIEKSLTSRSEPAPLPEVKSINIEVNGQTLSLLQSFSLQVTKPDLRAVYVMTKKAPSQLIDGKLLVTGRLSFLVTDAALAALPEPEEALTLKLVLAYDNKAQIGLQITDARVREMRLTPQSADALITANLEFEVEASSQDAMPLRFSQSFS